MTDYWSVLSVAHDAVTNPHVGAAERSIADALVTRLGERLDQLLMLGTGSVDAEFLIPVVTPLVLEIGDGLTPIVDSRQDGGDFLFERIPAIMARC